MSIVIPNEATFTDWIATADAVFRDELQRPPALHLDAAGLASMLQIAASGGTAEHMVAAVQSSPEWHALHDHQSSPVHVAVPRTPLPPFPASIVIPNEATFTEWIATADAIFRDELQRPPALHLDPAGLASMLQIVASGGTAEDMVAAVRSSPEWHAIHDQRVRVTVSPTPQTRLPAFPAGSFDRDLPWTPPKTRDFLRADAWGVPVPGLPFVPKGSSEHPERFLTYFDYKYTRDMLQRGLDAHAGRGYTHWVRSWPDARDDGGHSIDRFIEDCLFIKRTLPYVHVKLAAKPQPGVGDPRDQTPAQWAALVDPVMDALIAAKAVDEFGVWEWDAFNVPGKTSVDALRHMGQKAHAGGCSFWLHFLPEHTSWFADKDPRGRFGFYDDLGTDVDGLDYQAEARWDIGELQARIVDTLKQFAQQGQRHKMRLFERGAILSFTNDHPTEEEENLMGFLACCTRAPATLWGFGNGARMPDGSPL